MAMMTIMATAMTSDDEMRLSARPPSVCGLVSVSPRGRVST